MPHSLRQLRLRDILVSQESMVLDIAAVLENITGFVTGNPQKIEQRHNQVWHWFKHCFGFLGDIPHIMTNEDYFNIGCEIGRLAAQNSPGTYTKVRDNNDILVYWESEPGQRGLFMVVHPVGARSGEITTLFSPDDKKRYYDLQDPVSPTLH